MLKHKPNHFRSRSRHLVGRASETSDGAFPESDYLVATSNVEPTILYLLRDTLAECCSPVTTVQIIK